MNYLYNKLVRSMAAVVVGLGVMFTALSVMTTAPRAATLIVDSNGQLTGATGLFFGVALPLFDVSFVEGTCAQVFGTCDSSGFDFASSADAVVAGSALRTQVFNNSPFDDPENTFGCTDLALCTVYIPFGLGTASDLLSTIVQNRGSGLSTIVFSPFGLAISADLSNDPEAVFAKFTPSVSVVPLPAALPLFGTGLGFIGFVGWMRRRKLAADA